MSDLEQIVEQIGLLGDSFEISRWELCRAIETAYSELPAYTKGLTESLARRLKKSSDSVYSMRDAWRLREDIEKYRGKSEDIGLSSSHWGVMYSLRERFDLENSVVFEWLELAASESMSVRDLSAEVSSQYREDEKKGIKRIIRKVERLTGRMYQDFEGAGVPEGIRKDAQVYMSVQADLFAKLADWLG